MATVGIFLMCLFNLFVLLWPLWELMCAACLLVSVKKPLAPFQKGWIGICPHNFCCLFVFVIKYNLTFIVKILLFTYLWKYCFEAYVCIECICEAYVPWSIHSWPHEHLIQRAFGSSGDVNCFLQNKDSWRLLMMLILFSHEALKRAMFPISHKTLLICRRTW